MVHKSTEELLSEYLKYPMDEFLLLSTHDLRGGVASVENAANFLNSQLDNAEFDREQAKKLIRIILNSTKGLGSTIDATIEYHKRQTEK